MIYKLDLDNETFNPEVIMNSGQVFRMTKEKPIAKDQGLPDVYQALSGEHEVLFYFNKDTDTWDFVTDEASWDFWQDYFDLKEDYKAYNQAVLASSDVFLKDSLKDAFGMRILKQDLWETIISYMISQNNNIPKIKKSIKTLCDRYSDGTAFPSAQVLATIPVEELEAGTSLGYRAEYISEFAKKVAAGFDISSYTRMTYEEAYEALLAEKGIGPKVANCILLYGLHFMTSYPIDTWMKKIITEDYSKMTKEEYLDYINSTYSGYQGYIQQIQFYHKRKAK